MDTFIFGTMPKSTVEVLEDGTITIRSLGVDDATFNVAEIQVLYLNLPILKKEHTQKYKPGMMYLSLDGKPSRISLKKIPNMFFYTKEEEEEVERFIGLLKRHNADIETKEGVVDFNVEKKEKKKIPKNALVCPKCKSTDIEFMDNKRKGFSVGKAVGGGVLTGGIGTLAGFAGKKGKDRWHCKSCGHVFEKK